MAVRRRTWALALTLAAAGCAQLKFLKPPSVPRPVGSSATAKGPALTAELPARIDTLDDWPAYNRSLEGARESPLRDIDTANVARLRPACTFALGEKASFQSGLVVVGGTMYFTTATNTYAVDAATCALRWKHAYHYTPSPDFDLKVNRGVGYADGRVFRGTNDGRVMALDARTGQELWNVVGADVSKGETLPAAPLAWSGLVFIGNAGGDNFGVIGRMMAFDARTGGRVWSFELVPEAGPTGQTWPPGTEVIPRAGGATWTSYALDTIAGSLFLATGNAAPDFLHDEARPGANLYAYSVVELDPRIGTLKGWHQLLKGDNHDWDMSAAPSLLTTTGDRRVIAQAGKDGHLYLLDRTSGEVLFRTPVSRIENVEAPLTAEGTRFCPGVNGGVEWNGPAYSHGVNAFYVNSIDWCTTVKLAPVDKLQGKKGLPWTGSSQLRHPFGVQDTAWGGWLTAVDGATGAVRWRYRSDTPMVAGVTSTAGGLVFTGDLKGKVMAFDAGSGAVRWQYDTGLPMGGGVVTYRAAGRQCVAVAAGMNAATWKLKSPPAKVVVFGVGGP